MPASRSAAAGDRLSPRGGPQQLLHLVPRWAHRRDTPVLNSAGDSGRHQREPHIAHADRRRLVDNLDHDGKLWCVAKAGDAYRGWCDVLSELTARQAPRAWCSCPPCRVRLDPGARGGEAPPAAVTELPRRPARRLRHWVKQGGLELWMAWRHS